MGARPLTPETPRYPETTGDESAILVSPALKPEFKHVFISIESKYNGVGFLPMTVTSLDYVVTVVFC